MTVSINFLVISSVVGPRPKKLTPLTFDLFMKINRGKQNKIKLKLAIVTVHLFLKKTPRWEMILLLA